jgi:tetratricopeptide (TPR) repeat protein
LTRNASLRELLDRAAAKLQARKNLAPRTEAELCWIIGVSYRGIGDFKRALPFLERSVALHRQASGLEAAATLNAQNSLAVAYGAAGQSVPLFEETLKRKEAKLGRDHPETLVTVANLGGAYKDAGRLKEALPLLEEAYRAAKKYPHLRGVSTPLLEAYTKAGDNAKLANLLLEQLPEARKALPKDSPQLADLLAVGGLLLLQQKKWPEAEPLLRECLAIRVKKEPDDWRTFNSKSQLGGALLGQKKYAEAEPLLLAGYKGMKKRQATIPPQAETRLPEAVERLVQLYEATGRQDEAAKWRKTREAIKTTPKKTEKQP